MRRAGTEPRRDRAAVAAARTRCAGSATGSWTGSSTIWRGSAASAPVRAGDAAELRARLGGPPPEGPGDADAALDAALRRRPAVHPARRPSALLRAHPQPEQLRRRCSPTPLAAGHNVFAGSWTGGSGPATVELVVLDWLRELCGLPGGHRRRPGQRRLGRRTSSGSPRRAPPGSGGGPTRRGRLRAPTRRTRRSTARCACSASRAEQRAAPAGATSGSGCDPPTCARPSTPTAPPGGGRSASWPPPAPRSTGAVDPLDELADALRASRACGCTSTAPTARRRVLTRRAAQLLAGHRARRLARARPAQVAVPAVRDRLRAGARAGPAASARSRSTATTCATSLGGEVELPRPRGPADARLPRAEAVAVDPRVRAGRVPRGRSPRGIALAEHAEAAAARAAGLGGRHARRSSRSSASGARVTTRCRPASRPRWPPTGSPRRARRSSAAAWRCVCARSTRARPSRTSTRRSRAWKRYPASRSPALARTGVPPRLTPGSRAGVDPGDADGAGRHDRRMTPDGDLTTVAAIRVSAGERADREAIRRLATRAAGAAPSGRWCWPRWAASRSSPWASATVTVADPLRATAALVAHVRLHRRFIRAFAYVWAA